MLVFFLKLQNTQCGYHLNLSNLMDHLVLKMRSLSLEDSPQDKELLRLTPPLTRGWPRKWPLERQMWDSEPPISGQIKKLMDMATMVTSSLGMAGIPTATLLAVLVIITIQMGVIQGDTYWTIMLILQWCILSLGKSTLYLSLLMIWCTWEVIPQDIWCLNIVTITSQLKLIL
jgi:hypothetical protein